MTHETPIFGLQVPLRDIWAMHLYPTLLLPLIRVGARIDREARRQALCEAYRTADDALAVRRLPASGDPTPDDALPPGVTRVPASGRYPAGYSYSGEPAPTAAEAWDDEDTWEPVFPPPEHGGES